MAWLRRKTALVAAAAALCATQAFAGTPPNKVAPYLLVVSVDGLSWDRLQADLAQMPTVRGLMEQGAAGPLQTVFPSMTWPAHASLVTGLTPGKHGVIGNRYLDRSAGKVVEVWQLPREETVVAPTLYDLAKRAGQVTAAILWPNTSKDKGLDYSLPEVYGQHAMDTGASKGLVQLLKNAGIPFDHFGRIGGEELFLFDSLVRDAAVYLVQNKLPNLMFVHFCSVDTLSHSVGPAAAEVRWAMQLIDRYIAEILAAYTAAGVRQQLHVAIVSDHGFMPIRQGLAHQPMLAHSPLSKKERKQLRFAVNGHNLFVYLTDVKLTAKVAAWLAKAPGIEQVLQPPEYTALGLAQPADDPRTPDLIAIAEPNSLFHNGKAPSHSPSAAPCAGGHGCLPTRPELRGVFVLAGQDVVISRPLDMMAIDVAPTLAKLLRLVMPPVDGRLRAELLRNP